MNILLFAGTTEGREFAEKACDDNNLTVCVATEYGAGLLAEDTFLKKKNIAVLTGRLDEYEMRMLMAGEKNDDKACRLPFDAVVDATHPYAVEVTKNIKAAAQESGLPYYRLLRPEEKIEMPENLVISEFNSVADAADTIACCASNNEPRGANHDEKQTAKIKNIFVSTGSRELLCFTKIPDFSERVYVRVLPSEESLQKCREAGIRGDHIIAAQGPFSTKENAKSFKKYNISYLVTKESGAAGGYKEKLEAAAQCGVEVLAIKRPAESSSTHVFESAEKLLESLNQFILKEKEI